MSEAIAEVVKPDFRSAADRSREFAEVGGRAAITQEWFWKVDGKGTQLRFLIRPYVINQFDLGAWQGAINRASNDYTEAQDEIAELSKRRGRLRAELKIAEIDGEDASAIAAKLSVIDGRINELERVPSPLLVIAERFLLRVIAEWEFTNNGQPVPLTVEGMLSLDAQIFTRLQDDLLNFLFGVNRAQRR